MLVFANYLSSNYLRPERYHQIYHHNYYNLFENVIQIIHYPLGKNFLLLFSCMSQLLLKCYQGYYFYRVKPSFRDNHELFFVLLIVHYLRQQSRKKYVPVLNDITLTIWYYTFSQVSLSLELLLKGTFYSLHCRSDMLLVCVFHKFRIRP